MNGQRATVKFIHCSYFILFLSQYTILHSYNKYPFIVNLYHT